MGRSHLLAQMLRNPLTTGAVVASSRHLARAMAAAAHGAHNVIELGGGTGAVTRALRERFDPARLTVVELQPTLAKQLSSAFPDVRVKAEPAAQVLDGCHGQPGTALVSSLPFRSLPEPVVQETAQSIELFLRRNIGSWLVQFTYLPGVPFEARPGLVWTPAAKVWRNVPPARVWALRLA